jgi:hypothetical protein
MGACAGTPQHEHAWVVELERIDKTVVGDWLDVESSPDDPYFIRLEDDGGLLQGTRATFARFPSTWRAGRLHLIRRESLIVEQPGYGTCAFYVSVLYRDGGSLSMHWRPDVADRKIESWKDVFGSPVTENNCPERRWQRLEG